MKEVALILFLIAVVSSVPLVVDREKYFDKLYENVVAQIVGVPETALFLEDFEVTINNSTMNNKFDGKVKFYSGFVNRINKLGFTGDVGHKWDDEGIFLSAGLNGLRFSDFTITYDLDCQSEEYKTPSVMIFSITYLDFDVMISRNHFGKEIEPEIKFKRIGAFSIRQFPNNAHTQIIATEVNPAAFPIRTSDANKKFVGALIQWEGILHRLFEKAVKEVPYPELCYYCP